jgi:hypothetical protein
VLYQIPSAQLTTLDRGEGSGYVRQQKGVRTSSGEEVHAWVYVAHREAVKEALKPYQWYKRLLIEGAREHGMPRSYLELLEAIDAIPDLDGARAAEMTRLECGGAG